MEALIIIGCAVWLTWFAIKDQYQDDGDTAIYQENEEKDNKNDGLF